MRAAAALLVVLAACGSARSRPGPAPDNRPAESTEEAPLDAGVDAQNPCVAACVASRQMQATSIDVITRGCEQDCARDR